MKQEDLFRADVDFKQLADKLFALANKAEHDKDIIKRLYNASDGDRNAPQHWIAQILRSINDGLWSSNEDLAKQMDLNVDDHNMYVEIWKYFNNH